MLLPSRHQGILSRRFHVLNVTFRPVSSERQHTSGHTDSHETIKPFSWKEAGLKTMSEIQCIIGLKFFPDWADWTFVASEFKILSLQCSRTIVPYLPACLLSVYCGPPQSGPCFYVVFLMKARVLNFVVHCTA